MSHAQLPDFIVKQGGFDATQIAPSQSAGPHPIGQFPARIADTEIEPTKDKTGWFLKVTFETPAGVIFMRYNLANPNERAVNIARGQFSALCHATGILQPRYGDHCAALRGGRCQIVVGEQNGEEAKEKGYTEIKKVLDPNGNEPGKVQAAPTANTTGGWDNKSQPAPAQPQAQPPANTGPVFDPPPATAAVQPDPWATPGSGGTTAPANSGNTWGASADSAASGPWGAR